MVGLDSRGLVAFAAELDALIADAPKIQRILHEEIANEMKRAVDGSISSALNDSKGYIRSYQGKFVGSRGGYAAIRPEKGTAGDRKRKKALSKGALTTYLEEGHRPAKPRAAGNGTKPGYKYRARIKVPYISGRRFYANSYRKFEVAAAQRAQRVADNIAARLEGRA